MATLLHLDSSIFPGDASASRVVTDAFRKAWEEQHPEGTVIYRDLSANPVPHLNVHGATAGFADPSTHSPEQAAAFAKRIELVEELERADAVLIGAPMYNFTIASTLKAWLDNVILVGRTSGETSTVAGTPITVVASRGGGYSPGMPRESFEYAQSYLEAALSDMLKAEVDTIVTELTLAHSVPAMKDLIPLAEESRAKALEDAATKAKTLAQRLATAA
ncbi:FMN-dependent NADH-azoreductase [Streptomyces sp. TS71-3]|uniref:FMN-dependent NADH-azoreductase n=1 Tax=Streptomyces sp. TS71-3 TaxID=2733862 RepID=UPI001B13D0D1|nr:NAD(P)H-dependent oxidoreductase [Streptomyces sp. TS71-3]GHJ40290.1 FMN-dependent NADH-azoreductase [Streptomyces sp. TS71-3]